MLAERKQTVLITFFGFDFSFQLFEPKLQTVNSLQRASKLTWFAH